MKKESLNSIIFILLIPILCSSCLNNKGHNPSIQTNLKSIVKIEPGIEYYHKLENEVINLTIQSIIDSLSNVIKLNLGKDYPKYRVICMRDSLYNFGDYSVMKRINGVNFDSMKIYHKGHTKLEVLNKALSGGKELKVTSRKEYYNLIRLDPVNRVLLIFSRVNFNEKYNECLFTVTCTFSFNSGSDYVAYVKKENDKWVLKRFIISAIK
jgi:hypothetical protein